MDGEQRARGTYLRGFHSVSAALEGYESSAKLLTEVFGYELVQEKGNASALLRQTRQDRAE